MPDEVEQPQTNASAARSTAAPTPSGTFPDRASIIRLLDAVLAEQHGEWAEGHRNLGLEVLAKSQVVDGNATEEVIGTIIQAFTARLTKLEESGVQHRLTGLEHQPTHRVFRRDV